MMMTPLKLVKLLPPLLPVLLVPASRSSDYKAQIDKLQKKLAKKDAEIQELKTRYQTTETRLSKTEVHMENKLHFRQSKAQKTKQKLGEIIQKEGKIKLLGNIAGRPRLICCS